MKSLKCSTLLVLLLSALYSKAQTVISFKDPHIKYMGRIGMKDDAAKLTWSSSSIIINFNGTGVKASLRDVTGTDLLTVIVDNNVVNTIQPDTGRKDYLLVTGLTARPHRLELFKRTEYDMGTLLFYNFTLNGKGKILIRPVYRHQMEFYGNSITCGYAVEDTTGKDRGTYLFENSYKSYANLTARYFNAQYSSISKSGIGITVSWFPYVMPDIYNRLDANDARVLWDFKRYTPEVVVVNLLQNDSWLVNKPDHEQFKVRFGKVPPTPENIIKAYQRFIKSIRSKYANAKIICVLGNMDATRKGSSWPGYIEKAIAGLHDKVVFTHFFPYKNTAGHPNEKEQQVMADDLAAYIKTKFNWQEHRP